MSTARRAARLRFRPPPVAITPELEWLLARAFGPAGATPVGALDRVRVTDLADSLDLAGRVAARQPRALLAAEVGEEAAARLTRRRHAAAAAALLGEQLAVEVAVAAARHGVPLILLKGVSLHLSGRVPPGARSFVDLDLLAPEDGARALHATLVGMGFRAAAGPANEQHLPALAAPGWGALDLHVRLRGVTLGGGGWATAEELIGAGLCRPEPALPGDCRHLEPAVAAAHALAHGLDQHGWRPQSYRLTRMLADLLDLAGEDGPPALIAAAGERLAGAATPGELAAVTRLLERLAAGRLPGGDDAAAADPAEAGAAALLRHAVAGALDRRYAGSLRRRHLVHRLLEARRRGALGAYLARKLAEPAAPPVGAADAEATPRTAEPAGARALDPEADQSAVAAAPAALGRGRLFARLTALARAAYRRLPLNRRRPADR
jgi:hypothetical protein